jgi:hypothetical protein
MKNNSPENKFIEIGYKAGIALSFVGLLSSAIYLFIFVAMSPDPQSIKDPLQLVSLTAERRLLFLIQAKGEIDVDSSLGDYKLKIARLSPGLFVILCATVIIIWCANYPIKYDVSGYGGVPRETSIEESQSSEDKNKPTRSKYPDVSDDDAGIPAESPDQSQ